MENGRRSEETGCDHYTNPYPGIRLPPRLKIQKDNHCLVKLMEVPELKQQFEDLIRKVFREEFNRTLHVHAPLQRISPLCEPTQSATRSFRLCFDCEVPSSIFTCNTIEAEGLEGPLPLKVVLQDSTTGGILSEGPLSSARLEIVVLPGNFKAEDGLVWTEKQFNDHILSARESKRPLLLGERYVTLNYGVAFCQALSISDNSSWIFSRKFRLGVRLVAPGLFPDVRVLEGLSRAFNVRDRRGESYQKHPIPALEDEVWRLYKIGKDGISCQNLAVNGIHTVKDFLQRYYTDPSSLRSILGVPNNKWETIVKHAKSCSLNDDRYSFFSQVESVVLVFNCVLDIVGVTYDGLSYRPLEMLTSIQKSQVEQLRRHVYENQSLLVPSEPTLPFTSPSLANLHPVDVNQVVADEAEEHMNVGYPVSASLSYPCLGEQSHGLIDAPMDAQVTQVEHSIGDLATEWPNDEPIRVPNVPLTTLSDLVTLEDDMFHLSWFMAGALD